MASFSDLKELVKKKGYGSAQFNNINGDTVYLSRGIRETFLINEDEEQKIINAVIGFQRGDRGNAAEYGKESRPGHEYGRYEIADFEDCDEDTAVWIHRTAEAIKVYFRFER